MANPDNAATDPKAAAQQDQVKRDKEALEEQARRVDATTPVEAATDRDAAAVQDKVHADHDRMQEQARRVEASVPASVRDTPVERNVDEARDNADALRASRDRNNR